MNEDGHGRVEQRQSMLDATTRFEQGGSFIANTDVKAEVLVGLEILNNLVSKVMNVDDDTFEARSVELLDDMPKQGLATNGYQGFGHTVSDGFQTGTKSRREDHGLRCLHSLIGFNRHLKRSGE